MSSDIPEIIEKIKKRLLKANKKIIEGATDGTSNVVYGRFLIFEMITSILLCLYEMNLEMHIMYPQKNTKEIPDYILVAK